MLYDDFGKPLNRPHSERKEPKTAPGLTERDWPQALQHKITQQHAAMGSATVSTTAFIAASTAITTASTTAAVTATTSTTTDTTAAACFTTATTASRRHAVAATLSTTLVPATLLFSAVSCGPAAATSVAECASQSSATTTAFGHSGGR